MRTFEATACGIMLLAEWRKDLVTLFTIGEELETFKSKGEMKAKIDYYLGHEEERKARAKRGKQRSITEHTYLKRMEDILQIVESRD